MGLSSDMYHEPRVPIGYVEIQDHFFLILSPIHYTPAELSFSDLIVLQHKLKNLSRMLDKS